MIACIFATAFYPVGILMNDNYQPTKTSNLQTNFCFISSVLYISGFISKLFKCNSLYSKIRQPKKINWARKLREKIQRNQ